MLFSFFFLLTQRRRNKCHFEWPETSHRLPCKVRTVLWMGTVEAWAFLLLLSRALALASEVFIHRIINKTCLLLCLLIYIMSWKEHGILRLGIAQHFIEAIQIMPYDFPVYSLKLLLCGLPIRGPIGVTLFLKNIYSWRCSYYTLTL